MERIVSFLTGFAVTYPRGPLPWDCSSWIVLVPLVSVQLELGYLALRAGVALARAPFRLAQRFAMSATGLACALWDWPSSQPFRGGGSFGTGSGTWKRPSVAVGAHAPASRSHFSAATAAIAVKSLEAI